MLTYSYFIKKKFSHCTINFFQPYTTCVPIRSLYVLIKIFALPKNKKKMINWYAADTLYWSVFSSVQATTELKWSENLMKKSYVYKYIHNFSLIKMIWMSVCRVLFWTVDECSIFLNRFIKKFMKKRKTRKSYLSTIFFKKCITIGCFIYLRSSRGTLERSEIVQWSSVDVKCVKNGKSFMKKNVLLWFL